MPIANRPVLCGRVLWEGWELEALCTYRGAGNIFFSLSAPGGRPRSSYFALPSTSFVFSPVGWVLLPCATMFSIDVLEYVEYEAVIQVGVQSISDVLGHGAQDKLPR